MAEKHAGREHTRLLEVAREYRSKGYKVFAEPRPSELSPFIPPQLAELKPDLIAVSGEDRVVVEIKTEQTVRSDEYLVRLAEAIEGLPGWRLELVLTNPRPVRRTLGTTLAEGEVSARLSLVEELVERSEGLPAAYVLLWTAAEAIMRRVAERKRFDAPPAPSRLLKELLFVGLMSRSEHDALARLAEIRNPLVHGMGVDGLSKEQFYQYLSIVRKLHAQTPDS